MARQKRCSYCYQRGHTRPTCPELKKHIEENPDGYYARMEKRKAARKAARGATKRVCSYCKEPGHNKATCVQLKSDRAKQIATNKKFNRHFVDRCVELGFGPGALVELRDEHELREKQKWAVTRDIEYTKKNHGTMALVTGFHEEWVNACIWGDKGFAKDEVANSQLCRGTQRCVKILYPNGKRGYAQLPVEFDYQNLNDYYNYGSSQMFKIACPVNMTKKDVESKFSQEWKQGRVSVDAMLGI
jgi:hypothetical protein